jgi:acyl-CoA dehydrogenase
MNELRTILGDVVTRLFTDLVTKELLESVETGAWPDALWQAVEENGLTLPLVPESKGGAGGSWGDAFVVARAAGRHAVPLPIAETIVGSWLLSASGLDVPSGPLTIAPVHRDERLRLAREGGGWRLSGTAARVPWGRAVAHIVVVTEAEGRTMVAMAARGAGQVTADQNLAREPRDTLTFEAAPVVAVAPAGRGVPARAVWLYGALVRAAQMAAHPPAAGTAAANAFRAADRGDAAFEIAVAKVRVGEAAGVGASIAHQVHGAIGFTYEHALQFATRRLWSWRAEFGGEGEWATELGRSVAERGADALWPHLTAR